LDIVKTNWFTKVKKSEHFYFPVRYWKKWYV